MPREILLEGLTSDFWVGLPRDELDALVLNAEPIAFRAGSATVLGQFAAAPDVLQIELAHMDGGGEGVLRVLHRMAHAVAAERGIPSVGWTVHSANCARPNPKLNRVLTQLGFRLEDDGTGAVYRLTEPTQPPRR
jgi:hypothetical protein